MDVPQEKEISELADLSDEQLLDLFQSGNDDAFLELVDRYENSFYATALNYLKNNEDAQEAVQEAYLKLVSKRTQLFEVRKAKPWLHQVVVSKALDKRRVNTSYGKHITLSLSIPIEGKDAADVGGNIVDHREPQEDSSLEHTDVTKFVAELLGQLNPRVREMVTRRFLQQETYAHISAKMGIKIGTVKSNISRAMDELRERFILSIGDSL